MVARSLAFVLIAACGSSSPKALSPAPPALPTAHHVYTISNEHEGGPTHVTAISVEMPTAWHERYDDNSGSPAFEIAPNDRIVILNILEVTPAGVIRVLFGDAKDLQRTDTGDHTWLVDRQADGRVHAALIFPAQAPEYNLLCETRLDAKHANLLDAIEKICETVKIDHVEDKGPPTTTPKKVKVKDIVQPVLIEEQPK